MRHRAAEVAARLARDAEAVCRHYLSAGRREGRYWRVAAAQLEAKQAIRAVERRKAGEADPGGPVVAFRAAPFADSEADAHRIFDALNWARAQWPDMALATTGAKGGERLAIRWAQQKGVTLVLAKADFDRHGKAAPYGFRARAQEVAHELLGDLSRADAERRIWRETQADRFTGFDRRLLAAADAEHLVDDGVGCSDAWAALSRGRLRHLEVLGLATREGPRYRLDSDLETRLRTLQLGQDIIRTLHQRRLDSRQAVKEIGPNAIVRGRVIQRGTHDELGAVPWVIIRDREGLDHYARLGFGQTAPAVGRTVELVGGARGAKMRDLGRGSELGR